MVPIRVAVADSQRLFAEAMACALGEDARLEMCGGCSVSGSEIVRLVGRRKPDVALIDFWISDMPGPAAATATRKVSPSTRILFLTEFFIGPVQRKQARASGALWFLRKDLGLDDVVAAIQAAAVTPVPPQRSDGDIDPADRVSRLMTLSAREVEVLQVLRRGLSSQEAAAALSISAGTVKNHIHNILVKTGAKNQMEAMIMAEDEGFISGL